jgi:hypothetical protein
MPAPEKAIFPAREHASGPELPHVFGEGTSPQALRVSYSSRLGTRNIAGRSEWTEAAIYAVSVRYQEDTS